MWSPQLPPRGAAAWRAAPRPRPRVLVPVGAKNHGTPNQDGVGTALQRYARTMGRETGTRSGLCIPRLTNVGFLAHVL